MDKEMTFDQMIGLSKFNIHKICMHPVLYIAESAVSIFGLSAIPKPYTQSRK